MIWRAGQVKGRMKRRARILVATAVAGVALAVPTEALAAPGDLDTTFSDDGVASSYFGAQGGVVHDLAIDQQGRIVAAGVGYKRTTRNDIALARYLPDGSPDPSFSGDGRMRTNWTFPDRADAVAVDSKDRIVVAGEGLIARFRPGGKPDASFSGDGRVTFPYGSLDTDLVIDAHGRILVAGSTCCLGGASAFAVMRFLPNGTVDRSFGTDGTTTIQFGSWAIAQAMAVDSHGRIVVAGYMQPDHAPSRSALARLRPNGSLDPAFSDDGRQTTLVGDFNEITSLAIDERNRVVAGGNVYADDAQHFAVARYRNDGSLDHSFSQNGEVTNTSFHYAVESAVAIDPRGRIVLAGSAYVDPKTSSAIGLALAQYTPSGELDATFGDGGAVLNDLGGYDRLNAVAIDSQGRIVGGGEVGTAPNRTDFSVARYLSEP